MAKKQEIDWVSEAEAAAMLHMKPRYFRERVKRGDLKGTVRYSVLHIRATVYCKQDIENWIYENSTLV